MKNKKIAIWIRVCHRSLMYSKLQLKVKEHIVGVLCKLSERWRFDIDVTDMQKPIIVGYGPDDLVIKGSIEEFEWDTAQELAEGINTLCTIFRPTTNIWLSYMLIRELINGVFGVYGIDIDENVHRNALVSIIRKNGKEEIASHIYCTDTKIVKYISPFCGRPLMKYIASEELVSSFLLLLDPITYFKRYCDIIQKYEDLDMGDTLGIYEMLLEYFPEKDDELFRKYCALVDMFKDYCIDVPFLVGSALVDLHMIGWGVGPLDTNIFAAPYLA